MLDIKKVQPDHFLKRQITATTHLPKSSEARPNPKPLPLNLVIAFELTFLPLFAIAFLWRFA